ncbi:MAG: hypothetical protein IT371_15570 [Deltaproteobacteria bacterium]|nr:hypothetical protein [Deltaproteobacteria bacterium]
MNLDPRSSLRTLARRLVAATPPALRERLRLAYEEALRHRPYVRLGVFRGETPAGPLTVAAGGLSAGSWLFYRELLFPQPPREVGRRTLLLRQLRRPQELPGDLVLVEADGERAQAFAPERAFVVPYHVECVIPAHGTWTELYDRLPKGLRGEELRLVRKNGFDTERKPSRRDEDLERFFATMYEPSMRVRHGAIALPATREEMRQAFARSELLQIYQGDAWVGGGVVEAKGELGFLHWIGCTDGDPRLYREGVASAIYLAALRWANARGLTGLNVVGARPYWESRQLRAKLKWGATLRMPTDWPRQIWIKVQRLTPAVRAFLLQNPSMAVDGKGNLSALVFHSGSTTGAPGGPAAATEDRYRKVAGVSGLIRRDVDELV